MADQEIPQRDYFVNQQSVAPYHPANHTGTTNYRLIGPETVGATQVEVVLGVIEKGKGALPHSHPGIEQVCYMLEGRALAEVGRADARTRPGRLLFFPGRHAPYFHRDQRHAGTRIGDLFAALRRSARENDQRVTERTSEDPDGRTPAARGAYPVLQFAPQRRRSSGANRRSHDALRVDAEKAPQRGARVAAAEAVGAQGQVLARHPGADQIGHRAHIIGRGDHRAVRRREALLHPALARFTRMLAVPALAVEAVAAQLGETGDAPDIGGDVVFLLQDLGRRERFAQDGACAE